MGAARDESGRKRRREEKKGKEGAPEVTVMASGCLGLVSFPRIQGRATLEQLNQSYPRLVEGLRTHPGIGFMLIRSEQHGAVVLGPSGTKLPRTRAGSEETTRSPRSARTRRST